MSTPTTDAANAICAKAERALGKLKPDDRTTAEKRQRAAAMLTIAAKLDPALAARAAEFGNVAPTAADREAAANEVYSLANRRQSAATTMDLRAKPKPGWVQGGDDFGLPIQPDRLREAIDLFDIAISLHDESFWCYTKGLLQERLSDYAGAVQTFETIRGHYAQHSGPHLARCRAKLAGNYDPDAALDAAFGNLSKQITQSGHPQAGFAQQAVDALRGALGGAAAGDDDGDEGGEDEFEDGEEGDDEELDLAAMIAQTFAELLVDRDFKSARALLGKDLKHLKVADLQREFEAMIDQDGEGEEPDELEVSVMSSETGLPDMRPKDIGWVYVAINGDGFSEAISVIVTQEGDDLKIRELEWGRP